MVNLPKCYRIWWVFAYQRVPMALLATVIGPVQNLQTIPPPIFHFVTRTCVCSTLANSYSEVELQTCIDEVHVQWWITLKVAVHAWVSQSTVHGWFKAQCVGNARTFSDLKFKRHLWCRYDTSESYGCLCPWMCPLTKYNNCIMPNILLPVYFYNVVTAIH